MSEQIPAGWYPDPKDTTSEPRQERWWDGEGWTTATRPAAGEVPRDSVLEGEVLAGGPTVRFPEVPPYPSSTIPSGPVKPARPVLVAATVAALAGLLVGSGVTFLLMDGGTTRPVAVRHHPAGDGVPGIPGLGGGGQGGKARQTIDDLVNRISLPVPAGWEPGTTKDGFAGLNIGSYRCPDGKAACSLGGVITGQVQGSDAKAAAEQDIAAAAKESYGDLKGHDELKSEPVTVANRSGYLVRWKVDAQKGNNGYVETVVFPTADGKALTTVHLGFDIDPKAPKLAQMDTIVNGITDYTGAESGNGVRT